MGKLHFTFLWHHHQPYYLDPVTGHFALPWVRLHGIKDYWGMAKLLESIPELSATINLVPSLLVQLAAYTDDGHEDRHLRVSRLPADGLFARPARHISGSTHTILIHGLNLSDRLWGAPASAAFIVVRRA